MPHSSYDALLLVSFGGPEGMDDVIPFLENVLRGRNVPRERMLAVAKHYELFGGVSPINEQNRKLILGLTHELEAKGPRLPIYFGNRNWHPLLADTLRRMRDDGIKNALAFVTSAYSSYSSCRQYLEDIERAQASVGSNAPRVEKLRAFYNHPGFIEANLANVQAALERIPGERRAQTRIVFTAHSIPESMARNCDYEVQLGETSRLVAEAVGARHWRLVFQSRSGPPSQPWLGPDIGDYLRQLKADGAVDLIVAPIGFVSDHMEIIYDLDTEAMALSRELGMNMIRAATASSHPAFIEMVRELILERLEPDREKKISWRASADEGRMYPELLHEELIETVALPPHSAERLGLSASWVYLLRLRLMNRRREPPKLLERLNGKAGALPHCAAAKRRGIRLKKS